MLPAGLRRSAFSMAAGLLAPRPDQPVPEASGGIVVAGELDRASGLGEGARLMAAAAAGLGLPVRTLEAGLRIPGEAGAPSVMQQGTALPPGWPLILHVNAPLMAAALLRLPRGALRGRRIIGYWAWELPVVPPSWRPGLAFAHEIWAPSRFSALAIDAIAPGRVRVVPHPVAASPPVPSGLRRPDFGLPQGALVVLVSFSLASSFVRKNPLGAIAAFRAAFGDRGDRLLVVKVTNPGHAPEDMARLVAAAAGAANIRFETRILPTADSHALTRCADIVLSLHRSEGFGLVPAEAMLLGRPVIATDFSGTTDFLVAGSCIAIPYTLVPARDPRGVFEAPGALWAEPDIAAATEALRNLADDAGARLALGEAGRRTALARLGSAPLEAALRGLGLRWQTAQDAA
jgi:glycosyltransferase involved in cell wall biosynthesis